MENAKECITIILEREGDNWKYWTNKTLTRLEKRFLRNYYWTKNHEEIFTAWNVAVANNAPEVALAALSFRRDQIRQEVDGQTILHVIVSTGNVDLIKFVINRGALVTSKDSDGNTPLHYAATMGRGDLITAMLEEAGWELYYRLNSNNKQNQRPIDVAKGEALTRLQHYHTKLWDKPKK